MTQQNLAAAKLETILKGSGQELAAIKLETHTKTRSITAIAVMKVEAQINATVTHKIGQMHLETLLKLGGFAPPGSIAIPNTYRPNPIPCIPPPRSRFRQFWSTQPEACPPTQGQCTDLDPANRNACIRPGLSLKPLYDPSWQQLQAASDGGGGLPECSPPIIGATIDNGNYVRGLVLNILGTNAAQKAALCGQVPGQRLGYWLDDITGVNSGSSIRYIPKDGYTVNQQVNFVRMQANADMQKLVKYGVANSVIVTASYVGNNTVGLVITVNGVDDVTTVVNSTVTKISNAWVWNT